MNDDDGKLQLYLDHRSALIDYATPIVGDRMRAEDVVQEAFLRFAPSARPAAAVGHPAAYLYRIVRNLALDWTRRRATERHYHQTKPLPWMEGGAVPTPEQEVLDREELRRLASALEELPENARVALQMHRLGGNTLHQIAEHLGVSVTSAHRLVRTAIVHLATSLDSGEGDDG